MEHEPLHKMFNHNSLAHVDLFASTSSACPDSEPMVKSYAGEFNLLCDELAQVANQREQAERDHARRQQAQQQAERQAAESLRNRRQSAKRATRLVKSFQQFVAETPAKIARFAKVVSAPVPRDSPAMTKALADLSAIHARIEASRQQDAVRDKFAELYDAARAGELAPMDICKLDVLRIRAVEMGLRP